MSVSDKLYVNETFEKIITAINNTEKGFANAEIMMRTKSFRKYSNSGKIEFMIHTTINDPNTISGVRTTIKNYTDEAKFESAVLSFIKLENRKNGY